MPQAFLLPWLSSHGENCARGPCMSCKACRVAKGGRCVMVEAAEYPKLRSSRLAPRGIQARSESPAQPMPNGVAPLVGRCAQQRTAGPGGGLATALEPP